MSQVNRYGSCGLCDCMHFQLQETIVPSPSDQLLACQCGHMPLLHVLISCSATTPSNSLRCPASQCQGFHIPTAAADQQLTRDTVCGCGQQWQDHQRELTSTSVYTLSSTVPRPQLSATNTAIFGSPAFPMRPFASIMASVDAQQSQSVQQRMLSSQDQSRRDTEQAVLSGSSRKRNKKSRPSTAGGSKRPSNAPGVSRYTLTPAGSSNDQDSAPSVSVHTAAVPAALEVLDNKFLIVILPTLKHASGKTSANARLEAGKFRFEVDCIPALALRLNKANLVFEFQVSDRAMGDDHSVWRTLDSQVNSHLFLHNVTIPSSTNHRTGYINDISSIRWRILKPGNNRMNSETNTRFRKYGWPDSVIQANECLPSLLRTMYAKDEVDIGTYGVRKLLFISPRWGDLMGPICPLFPTLLETAPHRCFANVTLPGNSQWNHYDTPDVTLCPDNCRQPLVMSRATSEEDSSIDEPDCVAEGGHHYLRSSLEASFDIGLREHISGNKDTNTAHVASENILHGILTYYYLRIGDLHPEIGETDLEENQTKLIDYEELTKELLYFPSTSQMAALICMTVHAMAFEPATIEEDLEGYECPASIYDMRETSSERAIQLLVHIPALRQPVRLREHSIGQIMKDTLLEEHYTPLVWDGVEEM
ncbi:hypothetical protein M422DRAFT_241454 [Sphaerobolus stellatus SS14]|nr:hypothetical protein M422DRAFT_241454 [Sphaerobolus stellatus SS14]